jgi:hypothetical protein
MIQRVSKLLQAVEHHLPTELVSARARSALHRRAAEVPSAWFSACIECRLTADADQNDLQVYATRGAGGQVALRRALARGDGAQFGQVRSFLETWTRPRSALSRALPAIWLEYDLPVAGRAPDPFAFVCLYPDYLDPIYPRHRFGPPLPAARVRSIAEAGLRATLGIVPDVRRLDLLARCARQLPMHGRMLHVVARPGSGARGRQCSDLRIGAIVPTDRVRAWLDAIGWTGAPRQLALLDRVLGGGTSLQHVQVELGDEVHAKLAIDFACSALPSQTRQWSRFIRRLSATGCAVRDKLNAAIGWMASRRVHFAGDLAPARIDQQLFFKLTTTPDSFEAKAYLCFQPRYAFV